MAGSLAVIASEHHEKAVTAIVEQWEIQYSRFFEYASLSSTSANLVPLSKARREHCRGIWLSSSSSSTALLQLLTDHSTSEVVLTVSFRGKIQEEHFLYKLHFSWPQVSCITGFPPRGSRVVFVSYRDCLDQIQKFALQFPTICETQMFIKMLKENLNDATDVRLPRSELGSEISSQSESVPSYRTPYRARGELIFMTPVDACASESTDYKVEQYSLSKETAPNPKTEGTLTVLPPSFASLLTNCCSEGGKAQPTLPLEVDLKAQIMRFMEDSSFLDMLNKVEKVIGEMGYDSML